MDWNAAIEKNREALKRILTALVAMAELGCGGQFTFFPQKGALPQGAALAEKSKLSPVPTLPRHLYRAVLRLLRPAEAAARRLIIVAARGLVVPPPPLRKFAPKPMTVEPLLRSLGLAVAMPHTRPGTVYFFPHNGAAGSGPDVSGKKVNCPLRSLPLFDPLRRPFHRRRLVANSVPRICVPGFTEPFSIPPPPSPDDLVDATRLGRRLAALASALDDLPGHARRLARWKAKRDALAAQEKNPDAAGERKGGQQNLSRRRGVMRRISPLRPGRPPGWRAPGARGRFVHKVHDILDVTHGLAFWALESPDTS